MTLSKLNPGDLVSFYDDFCPIWKSYTHYTPHMDETLTAAKMTGSYDAGGDSKSVFIVFFVSEQGSHARFSEQKIVGIITEKSIGYAWSTQLKTL